MEVQLNDLLAHIGGLTVEKAQLLQVIAQQNEALEALRKELAINAPPAVGSTETTVKAS